MEILSRDLSSKMWDLDEKEQFNVFSHINIGRGSSPRSIELPKTIRIDEELMQACGMYLGDGKLSKDSYHLSFVSIDKDMVRFMLYFFVNRLNVKLREMSFTLRMKQRNESILAEWSNALNIPESRFRIDIVQRARQASCEFQIGSKILRQIFSNLLKVAFNERILEDASLRRAFLKGLFAAEGNMGVNYQENYIVCIVFCLHYDEEEIASLVKRILNIESVKFTERRSKKDNSRIISITSWKNYHKLWKMSCFSVNERKHTLFREKVKKTCFFCKVTGEFKSLVFNRKQQSYRQQALKFGITPSNLAIAARKDVFLNVDMMLKLCKEQGISPEYFKSCITDLRVNRVTIIPKDEFLDFMLEQKMRLSE